MFRRKGFIKPIFIREPIGILDTLIEVYKDHIGKKKGELNEVLSDCEHLGYNYKMVRGLASVLNSRSKFQSKSTIPPMEARRQVFSEAAKVVVTSEVERNKILKIVANRNRIPVSELDESLYADLENEQYLIDFYAPSSEELMKYYNYANMIALLAYSLRLEIGYKSSDEYLENLIKRLAKPKKGRNNIIELKPTRRLRQRAVKIDDIISRLLKRTEWSLRAIIKYPPRYKSHCTFEIDSKGDGNLLAVDSLLQEVIIEVETHEKKPPKYGEIVVIEEIARHQGKTSSQIMNEIKLEETDYIDLGGVLVSPEKHVQINNKLKLLSSLEQVQSYFKELGIRDVLAVLESFGYQVEWSKPRKDSRIYQL
jgi:predicted nuclease of restriction endonuclease-like RecB superfamily